MNTYEDYDTVMHIFKNIVIKMGEDNARVYWHYNSLMAFRDMGKNSIVKLNIVFDFQ